VSGVLLIPIFLPYKDSETWYGCMMKLKECRENARSEVEFRAAIPDCFWKGSAICSRGWHTCEQKGGTLRKGLHF